MQTKQEWSFNTRDVGTCDTCMPNRNAWSESHLLLFWSSFLTVFILKLSRWRRCLVCCHPHGSSVFSLGLLLSAVNNPSYRRHFKSEKVGKATGEVKHLRTQVMIFQRLWGRKDTKQRNSWTRFLHLSEDLLVYTEHDPIPRQESKEI